MTKCISSSIPDMGKHNKLKRKDYQIRRKQTQKLKLTKPLNHVEKQVANIGSGDGINTTFISTQHSENNKEPDIISLANCSEIDSQCSPFFVSSSTLTESSRKFQTPDKCNTSRRANSFSLTWEQKLATDPLMLRWKEFTLLQERIQKLKKSKF